MTGFDYLVLTVIGLSLLVGALRGVTSELLAIAAWIVAYFVARQWGSQWGDAIAVAAAGWLPDLRGLALRHAIGFAAAFVATLLAFGVVRFLVSRLVRAAGLGAVDRSLGALFGIVRGLLAVLAGVVLCGMSSLPMKPWWREAWLAPPLETAAIAAKPWLPRAVAQAMRFGYR